MDKDTIAIAGVIAGAAVTTTAALVLRRLELAKLHQNYAGIVSDAERAAHARGWLECKTKILLERTGEREVFSDSTPAR